MIEVEKVFVPREHLSNKTIYISRKKYDSEISNCLKVKTNIFISGESGSGKTWLYEIFFKEKSIKYFTINLAEISMYDSLFFLLEKNIIGEITNNRKDQILENCYEKIKSNNPNKPSFIVFDNLEHISSDTLKQELISLIHNLDNARYSNYNIRCMLVGIPNSLKDFFFGLDILFEPIANRIREIPKLNGFEKLELELFLEKTLIKTLLLRLSRSNILEILDYINMITDMIPLRIQQYLLYLSKEIINNNRNYDKTLCHKASKKWVESHYSELETILDECLLIPNGKIQKRNQVIYLLGKINKDSIFTNNHLNKLFENYFPITSSNNTPNISLILATLCKGNKPIVKKLSRNKFRLNDGRIRILINTKLAIDDKERIYIND